MPTEMPKSPAAAQGGALTARLHELAAGLRDLHHRLLDEQRKEFERLHGPIGGGAHLLHLVTHDPSFAWLRSLSALMGDLDALLEEQEAVTDEEAGALRHELEEMFSARAPGPFWQRCSPLLQEAPQVAMAYGRVRLALGALPTLAAPDVAAELHAKHRWAVARRMRGVRDTP